MSQYLLCAACANEHHPKGAGIRQLFAASQMERAEYGRLTAGIARRPTVKQRIVYINGVPQPCMDLDYYNCDLCGGKINPGDRCLAQTVWKEGDPVPADWEADYMDIDLRTP